MTRLRYARVACCVPFCRRGSTRWEPPYELLCGNHYRLADKSLRQLRTRVRARLRKLGERTGGEDCQPVTDRAGRIDNALWRKIKRQAIERAAGAPL